MHQLKGASLWRRTAIVALVAALALGLVACASQEPTQPAENPPAEKSEVILASTTSTEDSGLFDELIPAFEAANPEYTVKVIAVGTGEALKLGETKDADVLLVHAKADEEKFVANGYGTERKDVMYNDFLIVGPEADPAGAKSAADTNEAMLAIEKAGKDEKTSFISRGDDSGTHKKELKLWAQAGVEPTPTPEADKWYEETGQGMGETLKVASEKAGYTLTDRATYLTMQDTLDSKIIVGAPTVAENQMKDLLNQYGAIVVTDAKNQEGGQAFSDWIVSAEGQQVIGEFGVEKYAQQLFVPNAQ